MVILRSLAIEPLRLCCLLSGLPMLFHELGGLEKLMLEHNDMVYPPTEVVHQGCDRVRTWCSRRRHDRMLARQHTIVMAVQDILKQVDSIRYICSLCRCCCCCCCLRWSLSSSWSLLLVLVLSRPSAFVRTCVAVLVLFATEHGIPFFRRFSSLLPQNLTLRFRHW